MQDVHFGASQSKPCRIKAQQIIRLCTIIARVSITNQDLIFKSIPVYNLYKNKKQ